MGVGMDNRVTVSAYHVVEGGAPPSCRSCATVGEPDPALILGTRDWGSVVCGSRMVADFLAWSVALYRDRESSSLRGALSPVAAFWYLKPHMDMSVCSNPDWLLVRLSYYRVSGRVRWLERKPNFILHVIERSAHPLTEFLPCECPPT